MEIGQCEKSENDETMQNKAKVNVNMERKALMVEQQQNEDVVNGKMRLLRFPTFMQFFVQERTSQI